MKTRDGIKNKRRISSSKASNANHDMMFNAVVKNINLVVMKWSRMTERIEI